MSLRDGGSRVSRLRSVRSSKIFFLTRHHSVKPVLYLYSPFSSRSTENQVAPFYLHTPDGNWIYAWHVLPLPLYHKHEAQIIKGASSEVAPRDITATKSFDLLKSDPNAKLILYCKQDCSFHHMFSQADCSHHLVHGVCPFFTTSLLFLSRYWKNM